MNFAILDSFRKKSTKLCRKNPKLKLVLAKQFKLFAFDPQHPSLKFHRLKGKRSTQFAMWVLGDLRAIAKKSTDTFVFFDLLTHDEY